MAKLNTINSSKTPRIIIYGGPNTGKSLIAGKLAECYKIIWFDLENGHEVLFSLPESYQKRIELIDIPDTRSFPIAIETVLKAVKTKVSICEEHGKVGCMICRREDKEFIDIDLPNLGNNTVVVFDSLTQLTNSAIAHITKNEKDDYKLSYDDWGNLGKLLDIFLSHIQQAGYSVVVISHETEAETEGKKKRLVPVAGTRNFSRNVSKYFDHVVYAEKKNKKHIFSSSSTYNSNIETGSRTSIAIEDYVGEGREASLLPFFKPEEYKKDAAPAVSLTKSTTNGGTVALQTKDILDRLKTKT